MLVAVGACVLGGLVLAAASRPVAALICRLNPLADQSWLPVTQVLAVLVGAAVAGAATVVFLGTHG